MNYAGADLKFKIIPVSELLELGEQYFEISFKNRWGQSVYEAVKKDDCFRDEDGNYYFTMENVKNGVIYAFFTGAVDDDDYDKQEMVLTDQQKLTSVGVCGCMEPEHCHECSEHIVRYEQVWTANVDGTPYLVGSDGAYILTNDGKRIPFIK